MSTLRKQPSKLKLDSPKEIWEREYETLQIIPSSSRTVPAKALLLFSELLNFKNIEKVLDAGCGPGRNAVYLAQQGCQVDAVDFSEVALSQLRKLAAETGTDRNIRTWNHALEDDLPFEDDSYDLILDSYVSCHFIDENLKQYYRKELLRIAKPGGIVFSTQFSVEDEYYKTLVKNGAGRGKIVVDPNNNVTKQLYTEDEIKLFFSEDFKLLYFVKFEFDDVVLGQTYRRSIFVLIMRK
ncbi:MAG TPA: class I SAM-dependent methyltransferase [Pyrinomonadaceae bacterium]|jgi:SAM-dependent methyltransferase